MNYFLIAIILILVVSFGIVMTVAFYAYIIRLSDKKDLERTCYNCANMASVQADIVCHMWCNKTGRDFTYGNASYKACNHWIEEGVQWWCESSEECTHRSKNSSQCNNLEPCRHKWQKL